MISHEVGPLQRRPGLSRAIFYFSANVGCEDFKDPAIRVLVCHGPVRMSFLFSCVRGRATGQSKSNTTSCFLAIDGGGGGGESCASWLDLGCAQVTRLVPVLEQTECHPSFAQPRRPTKNYLARSNSQTVICNGPRTVKKPLWYAYPARTPPVSRNSTPVHARVSRRSQSHHSAFLQQRRRCAGQTEARPRQRRCGTQLYVYGDAAGRGLFGEGDVQDRVDQHHQS